MNFKFTPSHCIFCSRRLLKPKLNDLYTVTWCPCCFSIRSDKKEAAYIVSKDKGALVKMEIRVRNWKVILRNDTTFIEQATPYKSLLTLPYYLEFNLDPETLVHKIHTLMIFS